VSQQDSSSAQSSDAWANQSCVRRFDTQDGLYDLAFSEVHEHQVATASGDGSVKLWDMTLNVGCQPPNGQTRISTPVCWER
jgi:WD40 repeat protein